MLKFSRPSDARKTRGFSLLELLLVVGVGAVLILAGLSAYKLVSDNNAANQGIRQLQTLKSQVQQAFQGEANYGTAGTEMVTVLNNMRMLPPDMPLTGVAGQIRNGFGSTSTITVGNPNTTFLITFNNVSPTACARMGVAYNTNNTADFVGVTIGSGSQQATPTVSSVAADCANTPSTMIFEFQ